MPPGLQKQLPPRSYIDHNIEFLPGTFSSAQDPYNMDPKVLAELHKQLLFVGCLFD